jgi:hypothetical protein
VFTRSRKLVVGGLAITVAGASIAIAGGTGASENVATVQGKITPSKLDKKKFKPVASLLGVRNSKGHIDGMQSNPASEFIALSKNIKVKLSKAPRCTATLPNGSTPQFAKNACPRKSYLGGGGAEVTAAGPTVIAEPVVSVFNGPGNNQLRLHTYDPALGAASPIVNAKIVNAPGKWGQALSVPNTPETGGVMITKFNAKILKKRKVATAKCKPKKIQYQRKVTYKDGSSETVTRSQKCKVKR